MKITVAERHWQRGHARGLMRELHHETFPPSTRRPQRVVEIVPLAECSPPIGGSSTLRRRDRWHDSKPRGQTQLLCLAPERGVKPTQLPRDLDKVTLRPGSWRQ